MFQTLLSSDLPPEELTPLRLLHEGVTVLGAGIITTRFALTVASFHILNAPAIQQTLREELHTAFPDPAYVPTVAELERLPYLSAIIAEALRLSYGITQRLPRLLPHDTITYGDWTIPPNVPVGMDTWHMHHDERYFPSSHSFRPERWLNGPTGPDGQKSLSRFLVTFSKGTRSCAGLHLAYAELYIAIATVWRAVDMELWETGVETVRVVRDMFLPGVEQEAEGVRVIVK